MPLYSKQAILVLLLFFSTSSFFTPISAQTNNVFIKPPASGENDDFSQNPTWYLNTTQQLEWNTTSSSYYIALFQQQINGGIQGNNVYVTGLDNVDTSSGSNETNWNVDIGNFKLSTSNVFFFWVFPEDGTEKFTSHYFYIASKSSSSSSSTTSSLSSSTSSSPVTSTMSSTTITSSTAISTTFSTTASPTTSVAPPSQSSSKTGLGVGIGVGIGVALLLGCLIAFIYFKKRRTRRARAAQPYVGTAWPDRSTGSNFYKQEAPQNLYPTQIQELPQSPYNTNAISELPQNRHAAELPEG